MNMPWLISFDHGLVNAAAYDCKLVFMKPMVGLMVW